MKFKMLALASAGFAAVTAPAFGAKPVLGDWGYDTSAMDSSVKPGDDFWAYVNGSWDKATPIPDDRPLTGSFVILADQAEKDIRSIVESLANEPNRNRLAQQVGDFYASYMDQAAIDRLGTAPLKPYLHQIEAVKTRSQLLSLFAHPGFANYTQTVKPEFAAPIGISIGPDPKEPTRYVVTVGQATLGMPNREYYLSNDPKMVAHRAAYRDYIQTIQRLAGLPGSAAAADRIIALETDISRSQWEEARRRDVDATYNPMNRAKLSALAPQLDWNATLAKAGLGTAGKIVVTEPSAVAGAGKLLSSVPLSTWKEWLAFRFVSDRANLLPKAFDDASFAFYGKELNGIPIQRDRWKRGVTLINNDLGEAVGQIYVKDHFPASSEAQMSELIANLREAYHDRILSNGWMDETTQKEALAKLAAFEPRIGHPVKYIDYSPLKVAKGDALGNDIRSDRFQWALLLSRFPKPVDRGLWDMYPQTINADYDPLNNQITFPAAILNPPFFDPNADPAINYGAIGGVIGHEMGHGFDDQGRKFDGTGKLRDWWTAAAAKAYTTRADTLARQYDSYSPYPGVHINGKLTLGENLGDLGGLETAYAAYRKYVAKHGEPLVIGGLTGDQRFFIGWAQVWQGKWREDFERQVILTDPHSPDKYRANGSVRNVDAWYKAFNVQPGDKLYLPPEQRVHIWQ